MPTDALAAANANATCLGFRTDFVEKHLIKVMFAPDGPEKIAAFTNLLTVEWPKTAAMLERRIPAEGFLAGDKLSKYDIQLGAFWMNMINNPNFGGKPLAAGI